MYQSFFENKQNSLTVGHILWFIAKLKNYRILYPDTSWLLDKAGNGWKDVGSIPILAPAPLSNQYPRD